LKEMGGVEPIEVISRDVIESKIWETRPFRKYDILSPVPRLSGGRIHPLTWVMNMVREVFVSMGFEEYEGPWIETSFWNMDAMFIPQHHPARDVQDTFYLNEYGKLPGNEIIAKVKAVHENGWKTGSIGYGMPWNPQTAMMLVLRSHTTAVTYRLLAKGVRPPIKVFSIGRVFRNETPDPLHLPEFHQIEGFVYAKGLTLRHLMGYLKTFYEQFGITKLRFKPTYNPYTEPSMEIYAFNPAMNKWIEVANSGVFRPEATLPYGIKYNIIAWGLAVERLAGLLFTIKDIRDLIGSRCDYDFIRRYPFREVKFTG
ncbi:MAG: phenylalanine--tRNA ligase subunit alpha, partial [Candidatus Korarchaeota archaeon]